MRITRVDDCSVAQLKTSQFDLTIFGSGYEHRCTHLLSHLEQTRLGTCIALGFDDVRDADARLTHDKRFEDAGATLIVVPDDEETRIFEVVRGALAKSPAHVRILVDYSSMSRMWVNAILNFFKFDTNFDEVELTFSYTVGNHVDHTSVPAYPRSDYRVTSIDSLPTLEGASVRQRPTLALIGLGFEWVSPFAACERIEPDEVIAFCADPGAFDDYGSIARTKNREFLAEFSKQGAISMPLRSVETVYRALAEIVTPVLHFQSATVVPLGPKPHVLGAMLLANRFPEVTCLYVRGRRAGVLQVEAAAGNDLVVTNVRLTNASESRSKRDPHWGSV